MLMFLRLLLSVFLFFCGTAVSAHTLRPAVATLTLNNDATFKLDIQVNAEALIADIGPQHSDTENAPTAQLYNQLRLLTSAKLEAEFVAFAPAFLSQISILFDSQRPDLNYTDIDVPAVGDVDLARKSTIHISGALPDSAEQFLWQYPEEYGSVVLKIKFQGKEDTRSHWLKAGSPPLKLKLDYVATPRSRVQVAKDYTLLGFTHILPKGLDHILFVIGIFLLSVTLSPILWQVTAFTIAHTITLGLTIYGVISLSPLIVEPLIALSIVYVGVENMLTGTLKPWRIVVVFGFGLLHGMGFAGVLTQIGLPSSEFLTALISFNLGVEFGQLAVIAMGLLTVGWFRHQNWYRSRIVIPLSLCISLVGFYWSVERIV